MRLFVAIDVLDPVRAALDSFERVLRPTVKLAWSPVANLHITTKFIGEWPADRVADMTLALASAPAAGPIEIRVKGIGWFPSPRKPRVFWAGVEEQRIEFWGACACKVSAESTAAPNKS